MALYLQSIHQGNRYLIPTSDVVEVIPNIYPRKVPHAPDYLLGMMDYRGEPLPLVDVCFLLSGQPCEVVLSSRIVIVEMLSLNKGPVRLGWLFPGVTETLRIGDDQFEAAPIHLQEHEYLGEVVTDDKGILQRLYLQKTLPEDAYDVLFA